MMTIKPTLMVGSYAPRLPWPWGLVDFAARIMRPPAGTVRATIGLPHCTAQLVRAAGVLPADGKRSVILYMHGGAFLTCGVNTHGRLVAALSKFADSPVLVVNYRMIPNHSVGTALDDCFDAYRWLRETGYEPDQIVLAGDSAGGNLSAVVTQRARDNGGPALAFQLLWYPSTTADMSLPSMSENVDAPILDRDVVAAFLHWYLPAGMDITEPASLPPTLAPANTADLSGLPPAYIGTAEHDPIRDDGARYAELLAAAGVPVELYNSPTMVHAFVNFAAVVPAAAEATDRGLAALRAGLRKPMLA